MGSLTNFIDQRYHEILELEKIGDGLVRSKRMVLQDLKKCGFTFGRNSYHLYYESHERPDIVASRDEFVRYFLDKKDNFYTLTDDEKCEWVLPTEQPFILIFHDESTFRSAEQLTKR